MANIKKHVLLTGASAGLGYAILLELLKSPDIAVLATHRTKIPSIPPNLPGSVTWIHLDFHSDESVSKLKKSMLQYTNIIDVVINNAGYGISGPVVDISVDQWRAQFETNVFSVARLTSLLWDEISKSSKPRILNIGSIGGIVSLPYQAPYAASKFALEALTQCMRAELSEYGVEVCSVVAGDIASDFNQNRKRIESRDQFKNSYVRVMKIVDQDEQIGMAPAIAAAKIVNVILRKRKLPPRIVVANPSQQVLYYLARFLPLRVVDLILRIYYKI